MRTRLLWWIGTACCVVFEWLLIGTLTFQPPAWEEGLRTLVALSVGLFGATFCIKRAHAEPGREERRL